jgi:hypothetical protein
MTLDCRRLVSGLETIQDASWLIFGLAGFRFDLVADVFRVRRRF